MLSSIYDTLGKFYYAATESNRLNKEMQELEVKAQASLLSQMAISNQSEPKRCVLFAGFRNRRKVEAMETEYSRIIAEMDRVTNLALPLHKQFCETHIELAQGLRVLLHYSTKDGHTIFYRTPAAEKLEKLYPAEMQFGHPSLDQLKELARLEHEGFRCIDEPTGDLVM